MYNEEEVLSIFFKEIGELLNRQHFDYEIVCVDDGSKDNTLPLLIQENQNNPKIKVLGLSRNFGKEAAMMAAVDYAIGDAIIPIDADLQDPIELIPEMIQKWQDGFDVVCAKRKSRESDTWLKKTTANQFYKVFNKMSHVKIPQNVGDYRLMDRKVIEIVKQLPERNRFMKGLYSWPGFKTTFIEYSRSKRAAGESKFNYWKLWNFALDGLTSFTTIPLRISTYVGLAISFLAFLYASFIIIKTLVYGIDVAGYASLLVFMLFLGGIQLIFLGILGEYIGRIFQEVKQRPIYVIDTHLGYNDSHKK